MAGLFEQILDRSRPDWMPTTDAAFPELTPTDPPKEDDSWLSKIPQTLLPPHLRKKAEEAATAAIDPATLAQINATQPTTMAQNPSIQAALSQQPGQGAGMITGNDPSPFLNPIERAMQTAAGGDPGPAVPLPMARPAAAPAADGSVPATPIPGAPQVPGAPNAQPTQGQGAPLNTVPPAQSQAVQAAAQPNGPTLAPPTSPSQLPSILDKLKTFGGGITDALGRNSNTLLALGAGLAGAPNIGQGISRAAAAAIPARAADLKQSTDLASQNSVYQALLKAGVPEPMARAGVGNPTILKSLTENYLGDRAKSIQMVKSKDAWGNETEVPYVVNKYPKDGEPALTPAFKDASGVPAVAPGSTPPGGTATFAPGITAQNFDHTKVGEDYISQYSPEMQASMKSYLAGQSLPTGRQLPIQMVKMAAQKYGSDIGMPGDDTSISQRKVFANSLGNTQNGIGLASKGFQQGLEHFSKLSDNLVNMHLSNGMGLEPVAGLVNSAKNLTTSQQELVHKSDVEGQALAREMGNLFSKNGGGVHEAAETKKNVSNSTMSSKAAAGSLEAIDELMQGGLKTLEGRRDELFPNGNAPKGSQFMGPAQQAALEHIRNNIAILKGEKPVPADGAAAAAVPAPQTATGPDGHKIVVSGGRWVDAQTGKPVQ